MAAILFTLILVSGFSLSLAAYEHRAARVARRKAATQSQEADYWFASFDEAKWANQQMFVLLEDYLAKRQIASVRGKLVNLIERRRKGEFEEEEDQS